MSTIECSTLFDITETGVTGHCRTDRFPFTDRSGKVINTVQSWESARNQQRNLETIHQLLGMRTQINSVTSPVKKGKRWVFQFDVDHDEVFGDSGEQFKILYNDASGVPMMCGLTETVKLQSVLRPETNLWFRVVENSNG